MMMGLERVPLNLGEFLHDAGQRNSHGYFPGAARTKNVVTAF